MHDATSAKTLAEGRFLRLVSRDGWEFVERKGPSGVVAVVAITARGSLLLVEQHRVPVGRPVIELPAGLVGDAAPHADEHGATAARRELLEETGYDAKRLIPLGDTPTSPGLTSETVMIYLATDLLRLGPPAGDGDEQITLHDVPLDTLDAWLDAARARGAGIDFKIHAGVHLAKRVFEARR